MAVLAEAISVVVQRTAIDARHPDGWRGFAARAPNATLCADEYLARIGFMQVSDVESYVSELAGYGIKYLLDGNAQDLVVVDQQRGPMAPCGWIEFGHVFLGPGEHRRVAACRFAGDTGNVLVQPELWKFEGSMSQTFGFVPTGEEGRSLRFLRHENGADVYLDILTGTEMYVGRTGQR